MKEVNSIIKLYYRYSFGYEIKKEFSKEPFAQTDKTKKK